MRIGLDFDNTIVNYDALFHKVAVEGGHVPADLPRTKLVVRDHLRATDRESLWVEMQGYVYGARMMEAEAFPGVLDFLHWASAAGNEVFIVSHKTRHPFAGPRYDLHGVAREWIESCLVDGNRPLVPVDRIFFELTKEEKLRRIGECHCDCFVDDLPEILTSPLFPGTTLPILFDPAHEADAVPPRVLVGRDWQAIGRLVAAQCTETA